MRKIVKRDAQNKLSLRHIKTTPIGTKNYITQPSSYKPIIKGEYVIAPNFTYKRRIQ